MGGTGRGKGHNGMGSGHGAYLSSHHVGVGAGGKIDRNDGS